MRASTYEVQVAPVTGEDGGSNTPHKYSTVAKVTDPTYPLVNLSPGSRLSVRIIPHNHAVPGLPSPAASFRTLTAPPSAPGLVECASKSKSGLQLRWAEPASTGGSPITAYRLFGDEGDGDLDPAAFSLLYKGAAPKYKVLTHLLAKAMAMLTAHSSSLRS